MRPPCIAWVGQCDDARRACCCHFEQVAPVGIAADDTVEYDDVINGFVVQGREIAQHGLEARCDAILFGQPARHPDRRGNGIDRHGAADTASQQLDGQTCDASAAFECHGVMEWCDAADRVDQLRGAVGQAVTAEPSRVETSRTLAKNVAEAAARAGTGHEQERETVVPGRLPGDEDEKESDERNHCAEHPHNRFIGVSVLDRSVQYGDAGPGRSAATACKVVAVKLRTAAHAFALAHG